MATSFRVLRVLGLLVTFLAYEPAFAHAQDQSLMTHIEIVVRSPGDSPDKKTEAPKLTTKNIQVRQNGKIIQTQFVDGEHDRYRTHLLIVSRDPSLACAEWMKSGVGTQRFANKWDVNFTDVANRAFVSIEAVSRSNLICDPISNPKASPLTNFQAQLGRRILLFTTSPDTGFATFAAKVPEVYVIDGGLQTSHLTPLMILPKEGPVGGEEITDTPYTLPCHQVGGRISPNDPCNVGTTSVSHVNGSSAGIGHEKTMHDALKAIVASARDYYDLVFPSFGPNSGSSPRLELSFRHTANLSGSVVAYAEQVSAPGVLPVRGAVSSPLIIDRR